MGCDRDRYEKRIVHSPLFTLSKDVDETAYKRESLKMVENLYCYLLSINKNKYEPFGYEITVVASRCINGFTPEKGEFLNYFNAAWKQEYSHICVEQSSNTKLVGLHITEEDKRNIRKYLRYSRIIGISDSDDELYSKIAKTMDIPLASVRDIAEMAQISVLSNQQNNGDGEEYNLFDLIADSNATEASIDDTDSIIEVLDRIEEVFLELQERQRPIIAEAITAKIAEVLLDINSQLPFYSFVDEVILSEFKKTGFLPTQRDIARKYNRNEASISRTIKEFVAKLKERV